MLNTPGSNSGFESYTSPSATISNAVLYYAYENIYAI